MNKKVAVLLAACWTLSAEAQVCPDVSVSYMHSADANQGTPVGVFQIKNSGDKAISFPLDSNGVVYGHNASIEQRKLGDQKWLDYNPVLEELLPPSSRLRVSKRGEAELRYYMNDLLRNGPEPGVEYRAAFKASSGCEVWSSGFVPKMASVKQDR